ncbi:MAG: hypothetical protein H7Z41_13930 [Cytophagales bacterium]|nr:hypothetical protein [Armatimonadota bacterium]
MSRSPDELLLRLENRGELTMKGCALLFFTMFCILVIGVMSVIETAQTPKMQMGVEDPSRLFAPTQNHFGFLWLISSLLMFVAVPLYVMAVYRSALAYRFNRRENTFHRGTQKICRLRRIEYLRLSEEKDPDSNYLYLLRVVHSDGQEMLLHNGYEEREMLNLANAIGSFLGTEVKWRQPAPSVHLETET